MKKIVLSTLAIGTFALMSSGQAASSKWCDSGKPVKFAGITWESGQFITETMRYVLEKGYGCKTETVPGSTAATETALISGDLQVWAEEWEGFNEITNKGIKEGKSKLVGKVLQGGTVEGWFVPRYVVEGDAARGIKAMAPDLKSVSDLPKYKDLFKDDEDPSKGRLLGCVPGWVCEKTNYGKLRAYKLDMYTQFRPGSQGALDSAVAGAYAQGRPILFYYWAPTSLLGKYDFVQLQEPKYNKKCYELVKANDPQACPSATGSTNLRYHINMDFFKGDALLMGVFNKATFTLPQLQKYMSRMSDDKISGEAAAVEFLKNNKATWSKWVPANVADRISASLK